jgi:hydroxyethylthiazole kinase
MEDLSHGQQVTALGCALTCLTGAFAVVAEGDYFAAVIGALALFAVVGEVAAVEAQGPGSFSWRFLDALATLTPEAIDDMERVTMQ